QPKTATTVAKGSTNDGTNNGSGDNSNGGDSGSNGSNGSGNGRDNAAPPTTMRPADADAAATTTPKPSRVIGQVTGKSPEGVVVSTAPADMVDPATQTAQPVNMAAPVSMPIGKFYGTLISDTTPAKLADTHTTTTTKEGKYVFESVSAPGY